MGQSGRGGLWHAVNREDVQELQYITAIANVPSILRSGILSYRRAARIPHESVAMPEVQDKRSGKPVPGGRPLHEYVNLYFSARNPMLYKRRDLHLDLCVLRVSPEILDLPEVVIADGNAASKYTAFWPSPAGLGKVDKGLVFAEYWTDPDGIQQMRKARAKCAEVLVPDRVEPRYVLGAFVSSQEAMERFKALLPGVPVTINAHLFFRG